MKNIFKNGYKLLAIIATPVILNSCYYDKAEILYPNSNATLDCGTISAKFGTDVNPIIQSKCATSGCHDASASGGYAFRNYSEISAAKDAILSSAVVNKSMPQDGPLSLDERSKIKCWIDGGALDN